MVHTFFGLYRLDHYEVKLSHHVVKTQVKGAYGKSFAANTLDTAEGNGARESMFILKDFQKI